MTDVIDKPFITRMRLKDIEVAAYNPRRISETAKEGLREAVAELGMLDMPVVNVADGKKRLVAGHQRVAVLIEEGYVEADCIAVNFDPLTEKAANLALNNPAIQGKWDLTKALPNMDEILKNLPKPDHMQLNKLRKELRVSASRNPATASTFKKHAKVSAAVSKKGVVYQLGTHRLYCGDALKMNGQLFGKKKAHACVTDPPYNVGYDVGEDGTIENDSLDPKQWGAFVHDFAEMILERVKGPCYVFMSSKGFPALQDSWSAWGGTVLRWLAWVKTNPTVMVMRTVDFQNQYEWIMYGCKDGVKPQKADTPRTNMLVYPKPASNKLHPTQKPFDLIRDLVEDGTSEGEIVFDPFTGSGTTLCACEALKRVCFACEIDPHNVDIVRQRWAEQVHGEKADWKKLTAAVG